MSARALEIPPGDAWNERLVANVHPADWVNPQPAARYDLVVLGAGTAGLVTAAGAAGLGAKVALVERHFLGGDCLNVGCVPSKALLASARTVADARRAAALGLAGASRLDIDFPRAMERMRAERAAIARHDSAARFRDLGVDVFFGAARFVSRTEVEVGGARLRFARAVIATGGRPFVPPIEGLAAAGYRTNETVFDLERLPERLLVIGAGSIGCELAQAFRRFGARVVLVDVAGRALPRDVEAAARTIAAALARDGVELRFGTTVMRVDRSGATRLCTLARGGREERVEADEILVAAGRVPNVEDLGLELAGVRVGAHGVGIDSRLRTSNHRIFAAGDVASEWQFTHAADAAARTVIQNALFPFAPRRARLDRVPRVTYTDPELAQLGVGSAEAAASGGRIVEVEVAFADVDRARLDGETEGSVRICADARNGAIRGATIVGRGAGDLIAAVATAKAGGVTLGALANVIHPYPTRAEALRKAGDAWNRRRLTPGTKRWLARYLSWIL